MSLLKQRVKQALRQTIGEPYVGKRLKMHSIGDRLGSLGLTPTTILDAGSEDGGFVYWLADKYPQAMVTAIDIDAAAVATCRRARPQRYLDRVDFKVSYFSDLDDASYDLITAFDVLEHIDDDASAAGHLARALRPGGHLLVHVPRDQWTTWDGSVERVADRDAWKINPGHVRMGYSQGALRTLLETAGLRVVESNMWLRRYGVLAFAIYTRLEHPTPLRLLSIPFTDVLGRLDDRRPEDEGNSVWAVATKPEPA